MLTLGFANHYYTLWDVRKETRYGSGQVINGSFTGSSWEVTVCTFYRSLSADYDQAIQKIEEIAQGRGYNINLELRGQSREWSTAGTKEAPPKPAPYQFSFGKLQWADIRESDDVWQLERAYAEEKNPRTRVYARRRLIELGELIRYDWSCKEYDFENSTDDNYVFKLVPQKYASRRQVERFNSDKARSEKSGHFFSEGEKVVVNVKTINSISFDTMYGLNFIVMMETEDGKMVYYRGANPPSVPTDSFVTIQGTVKYSEYKGIKQTMLQRIKVK